MNKHDALRRSEECAYLEDRIERLRATLAAIKHSCVLFPTEVTQNVITMTLEADDARRLHWEHSGLNEQPS